MSLLRCFYWYSIFYVFIETNEVLQACCLYILILLIFLLKWIENKACDLLWTYGPKRKWGFDLKVSFKQQFPVYRGLWDISIFFCVVVYSGCTISLDGSCYIPIRILNKETRISSVALWRANQVLFYIYPITTVFQCFFCWNSAKWDMWF